MIKKEVVSNMKDVIPTKTQNDFLSSISEEILFGGNLGGGKSFALILDALCLNEKIPRIQIPTYRAIIYRKHFKDLMDLIDKSKNLYPLVDPGAKFNNSNLIWKFSSGAEIHMHYFENITDSQAIQGHQFSWMGVDELGLYSNSDVYLFVQSRLRNSDGLKNYIRATSNPSKYRWIRERFNINAAGESNKITKEIILSDGSSRFYTTQFIRSNLKDNPHIPIEYEMQLQNLSETDKEAFLKGNWYAYDISEGIYKDELKKVYDEGRFCDVPRQRELDIYAAFDIGRNDTTAIILYQFVGNDIQIFDHYENNNHAIDFYIDWLKDNGYEDAKIYLPHDAVAKKIDYEYSVFETVSKSFEYVEVVPKLGIEEGIDITKRKFKNIFINKNLTRLIECISSYKRKYNAALGIYEKPLHDWSSNTSDAFRYMCCSDKIDSFDVDKFKSKLTTRYTI